LHHRWSWSRGRDHVHGDPAAPDSVCSEVGVLALRLAGTGKSICRPVRRIRNGAFVIKTKEEEPQCSAETFSRAVLHWPWQRNSELAKHMHSSPRTTGQNTISALALRLPIA